MSRSRSRVMMVGFVAAVAVLSVGATAYAAEHGQAEQVKAEQVQAEQTSAVQAPSTPVQTPRATASPTPAVTAVPTATPDPASQAAAADTGTAEEGADSTADSAADSAADTGAGPSDGNVVEVRTPNPEAIPDTPAEYEHFYGLVTQCMADAGYDWRVVVHSTDGVFTGADLPWAHDVDPALRAGFTLALDGDTGGGDYYHWADAGCWGYAVHVTGNDGNN